MFVACWHPVFFFVFTKFFGKIYFITTKLTFVKTKNVEPEPELEPMEPKLKQELETEPSFKFVAPYSWM